MGRNTRRELNFPMDEAEYSSLLDESTRSALVQMESVIEEIRAEMERKLGELSQ